MGGPIIERDKGGGTYNYRGIVHTVDRELTFYDQAF